jgi:hypothetical protein
MIDDELPAAAKQRLQTPRAVGAIGSVSLLEPHHRQFSPVLAERVALAGEGLFLGKQVDAGCKPVGV